MTDKFNVNNHGENMLLRIIVFALCLMLLPFDLLSFINGSASANSDNMVEYNLNQDMHANPPVSSDEIQKSLWRTNITPAKEGEIQQQKNELQSLIDQINAMDLLLPSENIQTPDNVNVASKPEPQKAQLENQNTKPIEKSSNENKAAHESITDRTIQKLEKMVEKPEEIDNPYEIGNTLYLSNCVGQAAAFYEEALRRSKPDDMSSSDDRAWLLFQTANSLRSVDMSAAADVYNKLITEFPDAPWADIARVQSNIIAWYSNDKPGELLTEYKQ